VLARHDPYPTIIHKEDMKKLTLRAIVMMRLDYGRKGLSPWGEGNADGEKAKTRSRKVVIQNAWGLPRTKAEKHLGSSKMID